MNAGSLIPVLAFLIQIVSMLFAIRLMRQSGRRIVAIVLLLIISLMAFRRSISLVRYFSDRMLQVDLIAEVIALLVSGLILFAIIYITRLISSEKATREAAASAEARYRTLFESANDAIFILSPKGDFIDVNRTAYERLGYTKEEMLSKHVSELVSPRYAGEVSERIARIRDQGHFVFESEHVRKDGTIMPVDINVRAITQGGKRFLFSIVRDITAHKRVEDTLRSKTEELNRYRLRLEEMVTQRTNELQTTVERLNREIEERAFVEEDLKTNRLFLVNILNSIQDPIMVLDNYQNVLMANKAFEKTFLGGRGVNTLKETCHGIFYNRPQPCENCLSSIAMASGKLVNRVVPQGKGEAARQWFDVYAFPLATAEGRTIGSVHHMRDITTRRWAEEEVGKYEDQLRSLAHQLLTAEERERRKIAQKLHDGFLQNLALSKMILQTIQSGLSIDNAGEAQFLQIYELYGDMMNEARSLTHQLAPPVLYEIGLEPAVERLLKALLTGSRIDWSFENRRKMQPLRGELAPVLYAMVRELVVNVVKHAGARRVDVTIDEDDNRITVLVADDGNGMPASDAGKGGEGRETAGFGLFSIRERLRHLGGQLVIESKPGSGAQARIEIPFALHTVDQNRIG